MLGDKLSIPSKKLLLDNYSGFTEIRRGIIWELESLVEEALKDLPSHPLVKGRLKTFDSYYRKYLRLLKSVPREVPLITDLAGIRVICPFLEDIALVEEALKKAFEVAEVERKGSHNFKEFGYQSIHLLVRIPGELILRRGDPGFDHVEIQIRTILQNAWAEVEHELVYKAEFTPFDEPMKRKLAAVNASLSLADTIFQDIRTYQRQLHGQSGKRRDSFFKQIEASTDVLIFTGDSAAEPAAVKNPLGAVSLPAKGSVSMDDLLLNALYAHNRNHFEEAICFYSRILELKPKASICSLIYKHRGMANFARSQYEEAVEDFSKALEFDPRSYKALYYRGIVRAVLSQYHDATEDFSRSLALDPYQPFCLYRRAQAYYHQEDYPAALADCEASLALDPVHEPVEKFRAILLGKLRM